MKYFKTSAYKGDNIEEMIDYAIRLVYDKKLKPEIEAAKARSTPIQQNIVIGTTVPNSTHRDTSCKSCAC